MHNEERATLETIEKLEYNIMLLRKEKLELEIKLDNLRGRK